MLFYLIVLLLILSAVMICLLVHLVCRPPQDLELIQLMIEFCRRYHPNIDAQLPPTVHLHRFLLRYNVPSDTKGVLIFRYLEAYFETLKNPKNVSRQ